jgi:hypothetical protein
MFYNTGLAAGPINKFCNKFTNSFSNLGHISSTEKNHYKTI